MGVELPEGPPLNRSTASGQTIGFPSDGSRPPNNFKRSRRAGFTQRAKQVTATAAPIPGSKTKCQLNNHFAVAYLWGAPNWTVVPMFLQQLVVVATRLIIEGDKWQASSRS